MKQQKLNEKGLIVRLSISQWTARKFDKTVTAEIESTKQATESGRFNKLLIAKEKLQPIQKIVGEARNYHYNNTLHFSDENGRLLPITNYFNYLEEMKSFEKMYWMEVRKFVRDYAVNVIDAQVRLSGMYNTTDYPPVEDVESKYGFSMSFDPIVSADMLNVGLNETELAIIRDEINGRQQLCFDRANNDLWDRLRTVVGKMNHALKNGKHFKNTLVSNIKDVCDIIPSLNITEDKNLNELAKETKDKLVQISATQLRKDPAAKIHIGAAANDILKKIDDLFE